MGEVVNPPALLIYLKRSQQIQQSLVESLATAIRLGVVVCIMALTTTIHLAQLPDHRRLKVGALVRVEDFPVGLLNVRKSIATMWSGA